MNFRCIICGSRKSTLVSERTRDSNQKVAKCKKCNLLQLFPLPTPQEEKKFYDEDKQSKLILQKIDIENLQKRSEVDTKRRVEKIKNILKPASKILDVGCGYGFFVKALNDQEFHCTGLEVSKERRAIAEKVTGEKILKDKIAGPKNKILYDAISLFHVLEHITDPIKLCQDLRAYLARSGLLIIEVPNANDHLLNQSSPYRDFFWQTAHISYFTPETVSMILKRAGYRKVKIEGTQRYSFENAINWLRHGKPQIDLPTYHTVTELEWLEKYYKDYLTKKLICDTLWVEAKP